MTKARRDSACFQGGDSFLCGYFKRCHPPCLCIPELDYYADQLHLRVYDPDNPAVGLRDVNDTSSPEANDNFLGVFNQSVPNIIPLGGGLSENVGSGTGVGAVGFFSGITIAVDPGAASKQAYFRVFNSQPGNNWIVGVHDQGPILTALEFDESGVQLIRSNGSNATLVPDENVTDQLFAKRTLWIELDKMPAPEPHDCGYNNANLVEDPCSIESVDGDDLVAFLETYLNNTGIVPKLADYNESPTLHDFIQYGGGDESPNGTGPVADAAGSVRDANSVEHFWSVQVVSAYESEEMHDADEPDASFEQWFNSPSLALLGYSYKRDNQGPSVVYAEEVRDLRENDPDDMHVPPPPIEPDLPEEEQEVVEPLERLLSRVAAHEIMHRLYGWHVQGNPNGNSNANLMNSRGLLASSGFLTSNGLASYSFLPTGSQFQMLQSRKLPR